MGYCFVCYCLTVIVACCIAYIKTDTDGSKLLQKLSNGKSEQPEAAKNYGKKITSFFVPPVTGEYKFYSSCSHNCDVFLSEGSNAFDKDLIISQKEPVEPNVFEKFPDQASHTIYMKKNHKYFLRATSPAKPDDFNSHLSVGVILPDDTKLFPISKPFLHNVVVEKIPITDFLVLENSKNTKAKTQNDVAGRSSKNRSKKRVLKKLKQIGEFIKSIESSKAKEKISEDPSIDEMISTLKQYAPGEPNQPGKAENSVKTSFRLPESKEKDVNPFREASIKVKTRNNLFKYHKKGKTTIKEKTIKEKTIAPLKQSFSLEDLQAERSRDKTPVPVDESTKEGWNNVLGKLESNLKDENTGFEFSDQITADHYQSQLERIKQEINSLKRELIKSNQKAINEKTKTNAKGFDIPKDSNKGVSRFLSEVKKDIPKTLKVFKPTENLGEDMSGSGEDSSLINPSNELSSNVDGTSDVASGVFDAKGESSFNDDEIQGKSYESSANKIPKYIKKNNKKQKHKNVVKSFSKSKQIDIKMKTKETTDTKINTVLDSKDTNGIDSKNYKVLSSWTSSKVKNDKLEEAKDQLNAMLLKFRSDAAKSTVGEDSSNSDTLEITGSAEKPPENQEVNNSKTYKIRKSKKSQKDKKKLKTLEKSIPDANKKRLVLKLNFAGTESKADDSSNSEVGSFTTIPYTMDSITKQAQAPARGLTSVTGKPENVEAPDDNVINVKMINTVSPQPTPMSHENLLSSQFLYHPLQNPQPSGETAVVGNANLPGLEHFHILTKKLNKGSLLKRKNFDKSENDDTQLSSMKSETILNSHPSITSLLRTSLLNTVNNFQDAQISNPQDVSAKFVEDKLIDNVEHALQPLVIHQHMHEPYKTDQPLVRGSHSDPEVNDLNALNVQETNLLEPQTVERKYDTSVNARIPDNKDMSDLQDTLYNAFKTKLIFGKDKGFNFKHEVPRISTKQVLEANKLISNNVNPELNHVSDVIESETPTSASSIGQNVNANAVQIEMNDELKPDTEKQVSSYVKVDTKNLQRVLEDAFTGKFHYTNTPSIPDGIKAKEGELLKQQLQESIENAIARSKFQQKSPPEIENAIELANAAKNSIGTLSSNLTAKKKSVKSVLLLNSLKDNAILPGSNNTLSFHKMKSLVNPIHDEYDDSDVQEKISIIKDFTKPISNDDEESHLQSLPDKERISPHGNLAKHFQKQVSLSKTSLDNDLLNSKLYDADHLEFQASLNTNGDGTKTKLKSETYENVVPESTVTENIENARVFNNPVLLNKINFDSLDSYPKVPGVDGAEDQETYSRKIRDLLNQIDIIKEEIISMKRNKVEGKDITQKKNLIAQLNLKKKQLHKLRAKKNFVSRPAKKHYIPT